MKSSRTPEETTLADLLTKLIQDYDEAQFPIAETPPHEMIAYLMEQRGLTPAELEEVIGSRAQVSNILSGKRAISPPQAKKMAAFFRVAADLFIEGSLPFPQSSDRCTQNTPPSAECRE